MLSLDCLNGKSVYIYGYGVTGKWLSDNLNALNFIDTDNKKWAQVYNSIEVKPPEFLNIIIKNLQ